MSSLLPYIDLVGVLEVGVDEAGRRTYFWGESTLVP